MLRTRLTQVGVVLAFVLGTAAATYSVVRFEPVIVATYTVLAVLLGTGLARARHLPDLGDPVVAATLLAGCGVVTITVRTYTYVPQGPALALRWAVGAAALVCAGLVLVSGRAATTAAARRLLLGAVVVAGVAYTASGTAVVLLDAAPRIDVWYTLQGAADAIAAGDNFYSAVWAGPPGIMQAFTYLPWTAVLLAPGRWIAGDVRWALMVLTLVGAWAVRRLALGGTDADGPGTRALRAGTTAAATLLLLPGTMTMVEQSWTEPVLMACLACAALAFVRGRGRTAAVALALAVSSKQHVVLVVPLLMVWRRVGLLRTVAVGLVSLALVSPWLVADPAAILNDTVVYLVNFRPLEFADTLYIASMRLLGFAPPFWLTAVLMLGTIVVGVVAVHRRQPGADELLRWAALVLFVANLVNKQAFYNQFWLVAALVLIAWALQSTTDAPAAAPAAPAGATEGTEATDVTRAAAAGPTA